jgi:peptide/nickel transport system substrate-binding protein
MSVRFVPDATTEMTELLAGRADWIWNLNPDQFDNLNKLPHIQAVRKESMRVGYLYLDAAGPHRRRQSDHQAEGAPGDLARDRPARRSPTSSSPAEAAFPPPPCFPPQFGCDGEIAVLYDYNPAKAKQLLAEAGYPTGFEVELASYVLPQWGAAIQNYLQAVGHPCQAHPVAGAR